VDAQAPSPFKCQMVETHNGKKYRCASEATHVHYVTKPSYDAEGEIDDRSGITPVCAKHGNLLVLQRNIAAEASPAAGVISRKTAHLVDIPHPSEGMEGFKRFPGAFRSRIGSALALNVAGRTDDVPEVPESMAAELAREAAGSEAPTGTIESTRVLPEKDAVAHFNRLQAEKEENERRGSLNRNRRSRGLPAEPSKGPGRPIYAPEGMADVTLYSKNRFERGTGVEVSLNTEGNAQASVRQDVEKETADGQKYIEKGHQPGKGAAQGLRSQTLEDAFPPSANAPLDPDQTSIRPMSRNNEDLSQEDQDRAFTLNLVGSKRGSSALNSGELSGSVSESQKGKLGISAEESLGTVAGTSVAPPLESNKAYPLAVKVHHTKQPMAWHQGRPVMVEAVPATTLGGRHTVDSQGNKMYHWLPTNQIAFNESDRAYTEDEMAAATPYRHMQTAIRRRGAGRQELLAEAVRDQRSGLASARERRPERSGREELTSE